MVSVQEARQQIAQQRQQIATSRKQIAEAKSQAEAFKPKISQTQRELRKVTPLSQAKVRSAEFKRGESKKKTLFEIETTSKQFETQAQEAERQMVEQERQIAEIERQAEEQAAYERVKKFYGKGKLWMLAAYGEGLDREIARKMIKEGYNASESDVERYEKRVSEIKGFGGGDYKEGLALLKEQEAKIREIGNGSYGAGINKINLALKSEGLNIKSLETADLNKVNPTTLDLLKKAGYVREVKQTPNLIQDKPDLFITAADSFEAQRRFQNYKLKGEIYSPELNAFVAPSGRYTSGTAIIRPPVPEETVKMNALTGLSREIFGGSKSGNILTANLQTVKANIAEKEKLNRDIEKLYGEIKQIGNENINKTTGSFEGNQTVLEDYQKKIELYNKRIERMGQIETIGVGLFKQEQVPVETFRPLTYRAPFSASAVMPILGQTASVTLGEAFGSLFPEKGLYTTKAYNVTTQVQQQGTIINYGTPQEERYKNVTVQIPEKQYFTSEGARKVGKFVGYAIPYMNPIGEYLFATEQVGKIGGEIDLMGNVWGGTKSYLKQYPYEALIFVGGGILKGGLRITKKVKASKVAKYMEEPEFKLSKLQERVAVNQYGDTIKRIRASISGKPDKLDINLHGATKGKVSYIEGYPQGIFEGTVKEARDVGKIKIEVVKKGGKRYLRIGKAYKEFAGKLQITPEEYLETIFYDKGIKKVTQIGKEGKGTVKLYDKAGKVIGSEKVEANFNKLLEEIKKKPEVVKIEQDIWGQRVEGKFRTQTTIQKDLLSGVYREVETGYGFSDIIQVGRRKFRLERVKGNNRLLFSAEIPQKVKWGMDKDVDLIRNIITKEEKVLRKAISPTVEREISEGGFSNLFQVQVKQGSKLGRKLADIEIKKQAEALKVLKQIRMEENLRKAKLLLGAFEEAQKMLSERITTVKGGLLINKQKGAQQIIQLSELPKGSAYTFGTRDYFESLTKQIQGEVYVSPTSKYLRGPKQSNIQIPTSVEVVSPINVYGGKQEVVKVFGTGLGMGIKSQLETRVGTRVSQKMNQEILDKQMSKLKNIPKERYMEDELLQSKQELLSRQAFDLKLELKTKLETKQEQKQQLRQKQIMETKQQQELMQKTTPSLKMNMALPESQFLKKMKKMMIKEPDVFEAFVTKAGKETSIGKKRSKEEAEYSLRKVLRGTLRAGGFITKSGQPLLAKELKGFGGGEFNISKVSQYKIVQRREKRLGTRPERTEIQYFRKASGGKSKKGIFGL